MVLSKLPEDIVDIICNHLYADRALGTLSALSSTSRLLHSIVIPILYRTLKIRNDADYIHFLSIHLNHTKGTTDHSSSIGITPMNRASPLGCTKDLIIGHFPSPAICSQLGMLNAVMFPQVMTINFTLTSCHSILWGPLSNLRKYDSASHPSCPSHSSSSPALPSSLNAHDTITSFSSLCSPQSLCVHLNHYSVFDRDWNRFFEILCQPWQATLQEVHIHGLEYWLKPFVSGIKHFVYLDIDNVPYRPGTGLMVGQSASRGRYQCVETWAEVLLEILVIGFEREEEREVTTWEMHCPGARLEEIIESEVVLLEKLKIRSPAAWYKAEGHHSPVMRFVTEQSVACPICGDNAPRTLPRGIVKA